MKKSYMSPSFAMVPMKLDTTMARGCALQVEGHDYGTCAIYIDGLGSIFGYKQNDCDYEASEFGICYMTSAPNSDIFTSA